ncbi:MAG: ATP-binding cassette domain-containing protein [Planctomycetota bacterium]
MAIVEARELRKTYRVADKAPGMRGTMRHLLRRKYRDIEAVRGINLKIEPGEVVGFLGPNGAGKTTTLKMLTGLMHPSGGTVEVAGHVPYRRESALLRQITLVMGNKQQLLWDLPAADSLRVNVAVYGLSDSEGQRRIDELCERLGLKEELRQPVRKLSLGQRMKCELVAALLHRPRVLFLDEPTLGLDIDAQSAVRSFLREYNREQGSAILLTSHYMADITALCERVVVIDKGLILYDGTLAGVVERFAPLREVKVQTAEPIPPEVLTSYGTVEEHTGRTARLLIDREALTPTLDRLLAEHVVEDLSVQEPPIEEVIRQLFGSGIERAAASGNASPDEVPEPVEAA